MKSNLPILIAITALLTSSCSNVPERNVERNMSEHKEVKTPHQAVVSGRTAIKESRHLTEEEKKQFLALIDHTEAEVREIKKEEGQLKASLFQTLSERNLNPGELNVYKNRLSALEDKKMNIMFSSLDGLQKMLNVRRSEDLDREIMDYYRATLNR